MLMDSDSTIRPFSLESHPFVLGNYSCPTLIMDDLTARVGQWIGAGGPKGSNCSAARLRENPCDELYQSALRYTASRS